MNGTALIKNTNGSSHIGEVTGDLRVSSAHGNVSIDRVQGYVAVKTANGSVRVNEVIRGSLLVESAYGELSIGIREGTAAWLDVRSRHGSVHNSLSAGGPRESEQTAEVRARTLHGDILIHRSAKAVDQLRNKT